MNKVMRYLEAGDKGHVELLSQRVAEEDHIANVETRQSLVECGHRPPLYPMRRRLGARDRCIRCIRCIRCVVELNGVVTEVVVRCGVDRLFTTTISVPEDVLWVGELVRRLVRGLATAG